MSWPLGFRALHSRLSRFIMWQVISTSGDTHLGGEDFDHRVMDYFMKLIKKKYKVDISKDSRALQKLRREAERAKRALSSQHQARALAGFPYPLLCPVTCPDPFHAFCPRSTRRVPMQGSRPSVVPCAMPFALQAPTSFPTLPTCARFKARVPGQRSTRAVTSYGARGLRCSLASMRTCAYL